MRLKFLCVVAHPHDFTHCAGTMGIHHANGDNCVVSSSSTLLSSPQGRGPLLQAEGPLCWQVVSMTSGAATHNERLTEELMKPEGERDPSVLNQARSLPHLTSPPPTIPDCCCRSRPTSTPR